jgi:hypothetical protein
MKKMFSASSALKELSIFSQSSYVQGKLYAGRVDQKHHVAT